MSFFKKVLCFLVVAAFLLGGAFAKAKANPDQVTTQKNRISDLILEVCGASPMIPSSEDTRCRQKMALTGLIIKALESDVFPEIKQAYVILNFPPEDLIECLNDSGKASASVAILAEKNNSELAITQAMIQRFVANAVPSLNPQNVSVIITHIEPGLKNHVHAKRAQQVQSFIKEKAESPNETLRKVILSYVEAQDPGQKAKVERAFAKISPQKSAIYLNTEPSNAVIKINGAKIEQGSPLILTNLMVGVYQLEISKPGFETAKSKVELPMAKIKQIAVALKPKDL